MKEKANNVYGITAKELRRARAIANRLVTPIVTHRTMSMTEFVKYSRRRKLEVAK